MTRVDSKGFGQSELEERQKRIEEARRDPFKLNLDQEIFPLKDKVTTLTTNYFARLELADIPLHNIQLWIDFYTSKNVGGQVPLKATDTNETLNETDQNTPDKFFVRAQILTGHITEEQSKEISDRLNKVFRIKITDNSANQVFIGIISPEWDTGLDGYIIGYNVVEFTETNGLARVKRKHNPLSFPNTPEVTQKLGITFESIKKPMSELDAILAVQDSEIHGQA